MIGPEFVSSALLFLSASTIFCLGSLHLMLTFRGSALTPRHDECAEHMRVVSPRISSQTTMWDAWLGFNASHSAGAIFFGLVYGYLALVNVDFLLRSSFLIAVGISILAAWLVLAWRYWFRVPLIGIAIALLSYVCAVGVA